MSTAETYKDDFQYEVKLWQALLAEFIGTFALVFFGCAGVISSGIRSALLVEIAFGFSITLLCLIVCLGPISGAHFNPAVTIAMVIAREIKWHKAILYIICQLLGAVVGGFLASALPIDHPIYSQFGTTRINPEISLLLGFTIEVIATAFLVAVIFAAAVNPRADKRSAPFFIAFVIFVDIIAFGPWTGASMNPARSFGPAVAGNQWEYHWVYWLAPILGGLIGLGLHKVFQIHANYQRISS